MFTLSSSSSRRPLFRHLTTDHKSELVAASYAAYGVMNTITTNDYSKFEQVNVGVVSSDWPSWAIPFSHSRFTLKWIITFNEDLLILLRKCFPNVKVVSATTGLVHTLEATDIVAFNGNEDHCVEIPSFGSILLFDWNIRHRFDPLQWSVHVHNLSHSKCGGVTDFTGKIKLCVHSSSCATFALEPDLIDAYPAADLSSILSHTEGGEDLLQPARLVKLDSPKVTQVTHRSYHLEGLYPTKIKQPYFLIPSVFSVSKWVKRRLTKSELLAAYDIPVSLITLMTHSAKRKVLECIATPTKCLTALTSAIFLKGIVSVTGGGYFSADSDSLHNQVESRSSSASSQDPSKSVHDSTLPGAWHGNRKHNNDERAVKHDKAEVPIHFWNNSLAAKLELEELSILQKSALNVLRSFVVKRIWTRNVTRCLCRYLRCKPCHKRRLESMFKHDSHEAIFTCNRCKQHLPSPPKFNCVKRVGHKYEWREGGKEKYTRWYRIYMKRANKSEAEQVNLDIENGRDAIRRAVACTAWSWTEGSSLFFWRWGEFSNVARDGAKIHVQGELPRYVKPQKAPKKGLNLKLVKEKLSDVRSKGYIAKGEVKSITSFFDVPKGSNDIRLVYDATKSGLNDVCWAPWFSLQTCESHLRSVNPGTFMGDADLGEMFLNFPLDRELRMFAGVDFTKIFEDECEFGETLWERWVRMLMGFRPSPYCTTREMRRIDLFLRGQASNPDNVFRWTKVILNLPGMEDYCTAHPKVYRVREDGTMAADLFSYIDDLRNTAPTAPECWDGLHQVCCRLTWLGLQDAPRKRNGPTQTPRAWAGSIVHTDQALVTVLVSEEKWDKTKKWIEWVLVKISEGKGIPFKELLSCRGFLIYVSRTYTPFKPYLRGLHKTIDSWRPYRDKDGWKLMQSVIEAKMLEGEIVPDLNQHTPPASTITPLPRLKDDFVVLTEFTAFDAPPKVIRRRSSSASACYGFGDASGKGFGNAIEARGKVHSEFGQWGVDVEDKHSNYKELRNLVNAVEKAYNQGLLKDCELFLFTDNFVAECGYYNGGLNRNKDLDDLVHRLWKIQMKGDFTLHVYHVAGTRMIECGIDGLSRGDKSEGIARGVPVLNFIPIHLSPVQRSPGILPWIKSWWTDKDLGNLELMSPEDWFLRGMDVGNFLWIVPPGAGEVAVEQLCSHKHGRPETHHIFVIPRLCTCHWRKQLLKVCDIVLTIQPKFEFWSTNQHEPLLIGIAFPLLPPETRFYPWQLKNTLFVDRFRTDLHRMQASSKSVDWNILRKFLLRARSISTLPDGLARKLLQVKDR